MVLVRLAPLGLLALAACSSTPRTAQCSSPERSARWSTELPKQAGYGFSPEDPIHVGGGPEGPRAYLEALRGPDGQPLAWRRLGSCCEFETPNGIMGFGLLDLYEVTYAGMEQPVILYLDMYEARSVTAPAGFVLPSEEKPGAARARPKVIEL